MRCPTPRNSIGELEEHVAALSGQDRGGAQHLTGAPTVHRGAS